MDPWNPTGWDKFLRRSKQAAILAGVSTLVGLCAGYFAGYQIGYHQPERTVTVTKEVPGPVHTVTKTKTVTKTETKIDTRPLPDSCETVVDMAHDINQSASDVNKDGTLVKMRMDKVTGDILSDPLAVSDIENELAKLKMHLDDDLLLSLDTNERIDYQLKHCRDDIEKSNNGDDVAPLDGEPGTLP